MNLTIKISISLVITFHFLKIFFYYELKTFNIVKSIIVKIPYSQNKGRK